MPHTTEQFSLGDNSKETLDRNIYPKRIETIDAAWGVIYKDLVKIFNFHPLPKDIEITPSDRHGELVSATQLYTRVYELCCCYPVSLLDPLYSHVAKFLMDQVSELRLSLLKILSKKDDSAREGSLIVETNPLLHAYHIVWGHYYHSIQHMNAVFDYMNKLIVMERMNKSRVGYEDLMMPQETSYTKVPVSTLAFTLWEKCLLMYIKDQMGNRLIEDVLSSIQYDRHEHCKIHYHGSSSSDRCYHLNDQVREAIKSLVITCQDKSNQLSLYEREFESPLLEQTKQFYTIQSHSLLNTSTVSDYLIIVEGLILDEDGRSRRYYYNSHERVMKIVQEQLVTEHIQCIQKEFMLLLRSDDFKGLERFYRILSKIDQGIKPLLHVFEEYIVDLCTRTCSNLEGKQLDIQRSIMDKLISIHEKASNLISIHFEKNIDLESSLDKGFRVFMNKQKKESPQGKNAYIFRAPESIALYFDHILEKSAGFGDDQESYEKLKQLIILFKFVEDKDIFQRCYSQCLTKRLLSDGSISTDHEAWVIDQLKAICGYEYTSKMQRMFSDLISRKEQNMAFEVYRKEKCANNAVNMQVTILTSGSWPLTMAEISGGRAYAQTDDELSGLKEAFNSYYQSCYNGRKLAWLKELSRYYITLKGFDKPYELWVSYYQLGVLSCATKPVVIMDAAKSVGCNAKDLIKYLLPLMDIGLIKCHNANHRHFSIQDVPNHLSSRDCFICVDKSFRSSALRLKLDAKIELYQLSGTSSMLEGDGGQSVSEDKGLDGKDLEECRRPYLQALIIRIMKEKKEVFQSELMQSIYTRDNLLFAPSMGLIKKCLDGLVEKEYLNREVVDNGQNEKYTYVA